MRNHTVRRFLSLLLVLCLMFGMVPSALAEDVMPYGAYPGETREVANQKGLTDAIADAPSDGRFMNIVITEDITVTSTVEIPTGVRLSIYSDGTRRKISGAIPSVDDASVEIMFHAYDPSALGAEHGSGTANTDIRFENVDINGAGSHRLIDVAGNVELHLTNVELYGGYSKGAGGHGGGISVVNAALFTASHTTFRDNNTDSQSGTSGGAIYVSNTNAILKYCTFKNNTAHSGAGIYFFGGTGNNHRGNATLYVEHCDFTESNRADQRGGAIHCHGAGVISDTDFSNQESGQNGGAIYVSSQTSEHDDDVYGNLLLRNCSISGNRAGVNGGGIYLADAANVFLFGTGTTVYDNNPKDGETIHKEEQSNIFYAGTGSKIVVASKTGKVGVSTTNPANKKLAIYSAKNLSREGDAMNSIVEALEDAGWIPDRNTWNDWRDAYKGYTMDTPENRENYKQFKYDGEAWKLAILKDDSIIDSALQEMFDPDLTAAEGECKPGNMWLTLGVSDGSNDPHVVFDYNLPGETLDVRSYPKGTMLTKANQSWPSQPKVGDVWSVNEVNFTFLGWYTDPSGTKQMDPDIEPITVEDDVVYYARWRFSGGGGGKIPPVGKMYLVYFDQNYPGGGYTSTYKIAGEFHFPVPTEDGTKIIKVQIPWSWPGQPYRSGYKFDGWFLDPEIGTAVGTDWVPTQESTTLYGHWTPYNHDLTWNANTGTGGGETKQAYDTTVVPPTTPPTKTGYEFTGWYLDKACTVPLTSGTLVKGDATFYAGWTPKEYTITWDANYTGGAITTVKQYHDEKLNILPIPTREGYAFGGWYTGNTKAEGYGTVREDVTFKARWTNIAQTYTVTAEWDDHSDNDLVRPESITVALLANGIPTGLSYTLDASDADKSGNKWSYTFGGLDVTDAVSNPITYSVAITSTVSDQYSYGIENKSAELGYILLTHSLITTDINSYVVWEDDSNNDGYRPATVNLQLYANGKKVDDAEARLSISGGGDTWQYSFKDFQKYYTDASGNKGREIRYTLEATPTSPGELDEYSIAYHNYTVVLSHQKDTVSRTVEVEWQDNNNQDGKRPANVSVQLYADNVPLEGKVVTLSDANNWRYTWNDLAKYADGGREVVYSARVNSTLVDYTAKSSGMRVELTYVPSSTSISAFVTWTDEKDADGLRPDYITAQLVADGKPTGDKQVLSATNGWTVTWNNYPIYKDGDRIEYTFQVDVPEGYEAEYNGVYDTSGLSAVLTHKRLKQDLTGNIVWDDRDDQSGGRMARVAVLLYADGSVIDADDKVWISSGDDWEHIFNNLPIYRDHGQEIKYSMVLASDPGKYVPTTSKMTITMRLEPEFVEVPVQIIWEDNNDSDGKRPSQVTISLLTDGQPNGETMSATALTDWAVNFVHLDRYGANGLLAYTTELAKVPDGYVASYPSDGVIVLTRIAETKDVTATVTWQDNNDQYGQRPNQVTLTLYADYLDGNGPQNTGIVEKCKATEGWEFTFEDVPAHHNGKNIIYSVVASGNLPNYTISYDGMDVYMTHDGYNPSGVFTDYAAKVVWHDGHNAKDSRPYDILVTLYANGQSCDSYTMTEDDLDATGYTWRHTFTELPTKMNGQSVTYTIGVTEPAHYTAQTQGNTITLTHVMDIPILVRWHDQKDNDGVRPESLTLELFADSVKTSTAISFTGEHDTETWSNSFRRVPVWSDAQMDREILYTWAFAGSSLSSSDYIVDYNGFDQSSVDNVDLYPIDISRQGEVMDVPVFIEWNDDNDRDGLRLKGGATVFLYADAEKTDKRLTLTGSNEAGSWTDAFVGLPVWKDGKRIVYSIDVADKEGYTPSFNITTPFRVTMTHEPAKADLKAKVVWQDDRKFDGLTRFPVTLQLEADGTGLELEVKTISAGESTGKTEVGVTWEDVPVYYNHGAPVADQLTLRAIGGDGMPADYTIVVGETEDGTLTATVTPTEFQVTGQVLNHGQPIPTALINIFDVQADALWGTVITGEDGSYAFTVPSGTYQVQAVVSGSWVQYVSSPVLLNVESDTMQDFTLSGQITLCTCTITVLCNDEAASGAKVDVSRISQGKIGSWITGDDGTVVVTLPGSSYDFQANYAYDGVRYRSELQTYNISGTTATVKFEFHISDTNMKTVSGKVLDYLGNPIRDIITVECYSRGGNYAPGVTTQTDASGNFTLGGLVNGTYELILKDENDQKIGPDKVCYFNVPSQEDLTVYLPKPGEQDPWPSGYGTLAGIVTNEVGQTVGNAQVVVLDKASGGTVSTLQADSNGRFETQLPAGTYTVYAQELFDNITDLLIHANDQEADKPGSPVTTDSFTVSGTVLDEEGKPSEGVTVYLYGEDGQAIEAVLIQPEEDEQEEAKVEEVTSLKEIAASFMGATFSVADVVEDSLAAVTDTVVELAEGEITEATPMKDVLTESGAAEAEVTDTVVDKPQLAAESTEDTQDDMDALSVEGGYVRLDERVTAGNGKYSFEGLPAGRYVVKITRGLGGNGGSTDIPVVVAAIPEIPDGAGLAVTTDSYTVSGVVENKHGVPVAAANVTLLDEQGKALAHQVTDADGAYKFANLPKGEYTVSISYPDIKNLATGDVTISDGGFATFPGQLVSGAVKDSLDKALANVIVTVSGEGGRSYTATTDSDGNYRMVVPDGKYTVGINVNGKIASKAITVSGQPVIADLTIDLSTSGGNTTPGGNTNPGGGSGGSGGGSGSGGGAGSGGSIGGGGSAGGSSSSTEEAKTVLSGVVRDKDGNGVLGATITAVDSKTGETYTAITGPDGAYALAVPKGSYTITITYGSITTNPKTVTATKDSKLDDMTLGNLGKLVHGYVTGYMDGTFGGDKHISRSEVAALISRVSSGFDSNQAYTCDFRDVPENIWYANNLGYCVQAGLIQGRGNGHFDPNASITRAEFAAIVARFLGLENAVTGEAAYPDIIGNWAEGYITQLAAKGIVQGKDDGKFDPDANITRYEAVTMLNRALERNPDKAVLDSLMSNLVIRAFPDLQSGHWAYYQVLEAAFDHYHK